MTTTMTTATYPTSTEGGNQVPFCRSTSTSTHKNPAFHLIKKKTYSKPKHQHRWPLGTTSEQKNKKNCSIHIDHHHDHKNNNSKTQKETLGVRFAPELVSLTVMPAVSTGAEEQEWISREEQERVRSLWLQPEDYDKTKKDVTQILLMIKRERQRGNDDNSDAHDEAILSSQSSPSSSSLCLRGLEHYIRKLGFRQQQQHQGCSESSTDSMMMIEDDSTDRLRKHQRQNKFTQTIVEYHGMQREYGIPDDVEDLRYVSRQFTHQDRCRALHVGHLDALAVLSIEASETNKSPPPPAAAARAPTNNHNMQQQLSTMACSHMWNQT